MHSVLKSSQNQVKIIHERGPTCHAKNIFIFLCMQSWLEATTALLLKTGFNMAFYISVHLVSGVDPSCRLLKGKATHNQLILCQLFYKQLSYLSKISVNDLDRHNRFSVY